MVVDHGFVQIQNVRYYHSSGYSSLKNLHGKTNMYSAVKVFIFLFGIFIIPSILVIIPLYLKHKTFADVVFAVTESDVREIKDGISTLFCEAHTLRMNSTFNAFQIDGHQVDETHKKHFRLRKSMTLPDDSLEYWGFFLNKGSIINLSLCSRHEGGRIMIVTDVSNFHTCGLLEHENKVKPQVHLNQDAIHVTYETNANDDDFEGENLSVESDDAYPQKNSASQGRTANFDDENESAKPPSSRRNKRSVDGKPVTRPVTHMEALLHGKTNLSAEDSSVSSFEQTLLSCHDGRILLNKNFAASQLCTNFEHLENGTHRAQIQQEVQKDGYYFYIFYSDNDLTSNEFHAIFDIWKPTYEYSDNIRGCVNKTECTFPLTLWSTEKVIVEIPMRNGIEHEIDDVTNLVSTCEPRTTLYSLFLVAVLFSILISAFMGSNTEHRY